MKMTGLRGCGTALLLATLVGCGGGHNPTTAQVAGVGRVAMLVTDAPSDQFDQINITVTGIDLIGDQGKVNIYSDPVGKTFDLLALSTNSDLFSFAGGVPSGFYNKIRLTVANIDLVSHDSMGNITTIQPKLPSGKIDLNPRGAFEVVAGQTMYVQLDFDARKALHLVRAGNGGQNQYIFRPVIFIDVLGVNFLGRLVHVSGNVGTIYDQAHTFQVCHDEYALRHAEINGVMHHDNNDQYGARCITVQAAASDADTVFFHTDGSVGSYADLKTSDPIVVIGRFDHSVPAVNTAVTTSTVDTTLLNARVVELGPKSAFNRLKGTVAAINSDGSVDITLAWMRDCYYPHGGLTVQSMDSQPLLAAGTTLHVTLDALTPLFSFSGLPLTLADLAVGQAIKVEGVLDTTTTPRGLKATIVQADNAAQTAEISGTLNAIDLLNLQLTLDTSAMASGGNANQCVKYNKDNTGLFKVQTTPGWSMQTMAYTDLSAGMTLNVYGQMDAVDGCFAANKILVTGP